MRFNFANEYSDSSIGKEVGESNVAIALNLVDFRKLGFTKVGKFFPEKGFGFDENGVFFHLSQVKWGGYNTQVFKRGSHLNAEIKIPDELWIMKGKIGEGTTKGPAYTAGYLVGRKDVQSNGLDLHSGDYFHKYKAEEYAPYGVKEGEWWWMVSIYYSYGSTYTFPAFKLEEDEVARWEEIREEVRIAVKERLRIAVKERQQTSSSSNGGSTSYNGVGLHSSCEDYYE